MTIWDDTREDWGARPGRAMYTEQPAARTAFMEHYAGGHPLGLAGQPHSACLLQVRAWQEFHMGPNRGWSDLGYHGLVCQHGRAIEGRGLTFVGAHCPGYNRRGWGLQFMVGGDEEPTEAAKARMVQLHHECGLEAGRDLQVLGHRDGYPTECPGNEILAWLRAGMPLERGGGAQSVPVHVPQQPAADERLVVDGIKGPATVAALQEVVGVTSDGLWGPETRRGLQAYLRVTVDGDVGPVTVKALQQWAGATVDGVWGPATTRALQRTLNGDPKRPARKHKPKQESGSGQLLQRGSSGARVRALQRALNEAFPAYSSLAVDGDYGPATESVVREFQSRAGLAVDGVVGPNTRAALAEHGATA